MANLKWDFLGRLLSNGKDVVTDIDASITNPSLGDVTISRAESDPSKINLTFNLRNGGSSISGGGTDVWVGTQAAYDKEIGNIEPGTFIIITD